MTKPEDNPKNDDSPNGEDSNAKFGLNEPTGQFMDLNERMEREKVAAEAEASQYENDSVDPDDSVKYRNMGWKGVDDEEPVDDEEDEPAVSFGDKEPIPEDELDMTPMVDVTFLLLIFFMVTASFTIQKSLEQPHAKSDDPTNTPIEKDPETPEDYVQVLIDQTNTFYVTSRSEDEAECPSDSEMRAKVRNAFESEGARRLVIVAHLDSLHKKVVTAWDTGVLNDATEIQIQTTDEDY